VRECKCNTTLQTYAVKIFRSEDEEMFIHAEREFKILSKLKGNRNIIQGIEYIPEFLRSRGYLVMEKVEGQHLLNYISENGPLNEEDAKTIIK
jgi:serine/threonine protein kinase